MENEKSIFGLELTQNLKDEFAIIVTWSKVIAFCGFVKAAIILALTISKPMLLNFELIRELTSLIMAIVLLLFAKKLNAYLQQDNVGALEDSFKKLALYFLLNLVLIIVVIALAFVSFFYYFRF